MACSSSRIEICRTSFSRSFLAATMAVLAFYIEQSPAHPSYVRASRRLVRGFSWSSSVLFGVPKGPAHEALTTSQKPAQNSPMIIQKAINSNMASRGSRKP